MDQEMIQSQIDAVIAHCEELVSEAWVGPARAFFEIPVEKNFMVRGVYRVYIVQAPTVNEALKGLQGVIEDQINAAAGRSMIVNLVWRLPDKIQVEQTEGDTSWRARTRLTVLPEEER